MFRTLETGLAGSGALVAVWQQGVGGRFIASGHGGPLTLSYRKGPRHLNSSFKVYYHHIHIFL